jgi:hypothetical protein
MELLLIMLQLHVLRLCKCFRNLLCAKLPILYIKDKDFCICRCNILYDTISFLHSFLTLQIRAIINVLH